jgi:hypothetical protein
MRDVEVHQSETIPSLQEGKPGHRFPRSCVRRNRPAPTSTGVRSTPLMPGLRKSSARIRKAHTSVRSRTPRSGNRCPAIRGVGSPSRCTANPRSSIARTATKCSTPAFDSVEQVRDVTETWLSALFSTGISRQHSERRRFRPGVGGHGLRRGGARAPPDGPACANVSARRRRICRSLAFPQRDGYRRSRRQHRREAAADKARCAGPGGAKGD